MAPAKKRSESVAVLEGTTRTLAVLEALAQQGEAQLAEIARTAGLPRAATYRVLRSLEAAGYAGQNPETGHYRRGPAFLRLFSAWLSWFEIRNVAKPVLEELAASAEETAHFVVYEDGKAFYAEKAESEKALRIASRVGAFLALHSTAAGKSILAFLPPEERDEVLRNAGFERRGPNTITSAADLMAQLSDIVKRGYALDDREDNAEIRCVGAPVFGRDGRPIGAVSLSAPVHRLPLSQVPRLAPLVRHAAADITGRYSGIDWEKILSHIQQSSLAPSSSRRSAQAVLRSSRG